MSEQAGLDVPQAMRQQYWSELDADGRIKRMREQVKAAGREIQELRAIVARLTEHVHVGDKIAYLDSFGHPCGMGTVSGSQFTLAGGDEVYF